MSRVFVIRLGNIWQRIACACGKRFLPSAQETSQCLAPELALPIREAFLRGIVARQVVRVLTTQTGDKLLPIIADGCPGFDLEWKSCTLRALINTA